jgi:hypothetical protein
MKTECARTRKALPKYLHGHLFKLEQIRIERHLRSCMVCYSQYQALKRADETRKYLKDITPPEGVVQIMKESVFGLKKLKKILYRPLWIVGILIVALVAVYYLNKPRQIEVEIDNIIKTAPSQTEQLAYAPLTSAIHTADITPQGTRRSATSERTQEPLTDPLLVTITTDNDKLALRRINEVMRGHAQLRKYKLTEMVREISGSLTPKELLTFFHRIESVVKINYNRKKFESFPNSQPIPFVMRLVLAPRTLEEQAPSAQFHKQSDHAEVPSAPTATAPTGTVTQ